MTHEHGTSPEEIETFRQTIDDEVLADNRNLRLLFQCTLAALTGPDTGQRDRALEVFELYGKEEEEVPESTVETPPQAHPAN